MEQEQNVTPLETAEVLQTLVQPSERTAKGADSYIRAEEGQEVVNYTQPPVKRRNAAISPGVLSIVKEGVVNVDHLTFTAGVDVSKMSQHNWTLRKVKLFFVVNKYIPMYKPEVQALKDGLTSTALSDIADTGGTFLNKDTTTEPILLRDMSVDVDGVNGHRTEYMDKTLKELQEIAHIETTYWLNTTIDDDNVKLESTEDLLHVRVVKAEVTDAKGNVKMDKDGKPLRRRAVRLTFNNLWLYTPMFTQVPENFNELLDAYGNDTPVFLPLLLHFIEKRGPKTEGKHIKAARNKKVEKMKATKTEGDKWSGYIADGTNRQTSQLYRQQKLSEIIGKENMGSYVYNRVIWEDPKTKTTPKYQYPNWFDAGAFLKAVTRSLCGFVNMKLLTKARAFVIPKQQAKRDALVAELCKEFPGYTKDIKALTPADGVCCLVTYNGTWAKEEKVPFTPTREVGKPRGKSGKKREKKAKKS